LLGPFTDNGDPLRFGMMHYTNATSSFCERVKPRDVKTALVLLNYLFLEHHTVENLLLVDSARGCTDKKNKKINCPKLKFEVGIL